MRRAKDKFKVGDLVEDVTMPPRFARRTCLGIVMGIGMDYPCDTLWHYHLGRSTYVDIKWTNCKLQKRLYLCHRNWNDIQVVSAEYRKKKK